MPKKETIQQLRGQAANGFVAGCEGELVITLSGPKGCGKSLVFKVLTGLLPLLALDTATVVIERGQS